MVRVALDVKVNPDDTLNIAISSIEDNLSSLSLKLTASNWILKFINWFGHLGPIENLNSWIIKKVIGILPKQIDKVIDKMINKLTYEEVVDLSILKLPQFKGKLVGFDYHVEDLNIIESASDTFLELSLNATVYDGSQPHTSPDIAPPVALPDWFTDDTIRFQLQAYTLNSLLWTADHEKLLNFNLT
ncbi:MAG: hypothetical protein V2I33_16750 [Kangiellaceae bacterium]|jgi:hypothetical protein|nr:hypothetical protein [Kangiellaceae bacterium]